MVSDYIEQVRAESPTLQEKVFLNHASRGPLHGRTLKAIHKYSEHWKAFDFKESNEIAQATKKKFGLLINASEDEIVFTPDVTSGSRYAANMMKYDKDSNIVCFWNDYVGQVYQALFLEKTKNIEYRPVPDNNYVLKPELFAEKIDQNTKLVLLSHVQWLTGSRADVKEITKIAHENGALVVIDSIQSSGALINNVKDWDVDFLTCGVAKWLLGPNQVGLFYIKKELIDEFDPPFAGYHGTDSGSKDEPYWSVDEIKYVEGIKKYRVTNTSDFLLYVASCGLDIILDYGIKKVQERIFLLTDYLIEELQGLGLSEFNTPLEKEYRSGIINVKAPNNIELVKKLRGDNIIISSRFGGLRISPHFYSTTEDIDILISSLKNHLS